MALTIAEINVGRGGLAITPMPGRSGAYAADLADLAAWRPDLVLTLTPRDELARFAPDLQADLGRHNIAWQAFPIIDYATPQSGWPPVSHHIHAVLAQSGRVLLHCMGGCGRSGMIALRLMVETGEAAEAALIRLREARPCAVETDAQLLWASQPRQFD